LVGTGQVRNKCPGLKGWGFGFDRELDNIVLIIIRGGHRSHWMVWYFSLPKKYPST